MPHTIAAAGLVLSPLMEFVLFLAVGLGSVLYVIIARKMGWDGTRKKTFSYPTHPTITAPANARPASTQIDSVRILLGEAPRSFPKSLAKYLTVEPPDWLKTNRDDEDWISIKNQDRVRREGLVVWSTVVQANNYLYEKSAVESGASVIYSADPWFDRNRDALAEIARRCMALKGTDPADPEAAAFARMLTNEYARGMRLRVPRAFTAGRAVFHSSLLMPRKHFPRGVLAGRFFPVWIDREETGAIIMVPAAYWPASLTAEWRQD